MKLYCISGLGADKRVFQYLDLDYDIIALEWIDSLANERIEAYSMRLADKINIKEAFGILGVSFGRLIAVEISKQLNPSITILISSAETKYELRTIYRLLALLGILKVIPSMLFNPPRGLAHWIFGANEKKLLNQILNDTDLKFAKWSAIELTSWKNTYRLSNPKIKLIGTKDKLIPSQKNSDSILISNGEHLMIVDRASEISAIINNQLLSLNLLS